ncbi:MAG: hypothetical protein CSA11_03210 [Chloroflexi bacterium]|nr:MAG: hypothetical protein CSB13_04305 [Chloroflexota bacterium]PIE81672.1 MAG: hypothetical protein CSA11_03210 [Chloroflexota bacterium]
MVSGKAAIDWPTFFKDYEAAVDAPVCFYFEELLQAFPEAKVILTVRDPKEWHKSLKGLIRVSNRMRPFGYVVPKLGRFLDLTFELLDKFMPGFETYDQDAFVQFFNEHNAAVKRIVPEDRLLVFQVKDGWEPLCTFLDCEVPQDIPFPRLNTGMLGPETKMRQVFNIK